MSIYLENNIKTFENYQMNLATLKKLDSNFAVFGSETHRYKLNKVISTKEIQAFERDHQVKLPMVLKDYYLTCANGGAGPGYGIKSLNNIFIIHFNKQEQQKLNLPSIFLGVIDYGCGSYHGFKADEDSNSLYSYDVTYDENCGLTNKTFIQLCLNWTEKEINKLNSFYK